MGIDSVTNEMKFDNTGVGKFYNRNYKPESLAEEFPWLAGITDMATGSNLKKFADDYVRMQENLPNVVKDLYEKNLESVPTFGAEASRDIEKQIQGLLPQAIVPKVVSNQQKDGVGIKPNVDISGLYESTLPAFESKGRGTPKIEGIPDSTNKQVVETETPEERALVEGLDSFIEGVRGTGAPAPEVKSLEEYKQLLSDITGVDMSGKVDKSAALMSFGLALMQNRAGKGFNLGRMMRSVGEAGEVALPKLEAAKKEARAAAIEGGKYALQAQTADKAAARAAAEKSMVRDKYWIYEKGGKGQEFANFDRGQFENLSMYEMNKLLSDPEFDKKYEFISAADRMSILQKRAEALNVDLGDKYDDNKLISLIGGDPKDAPVELQIYAAAVNPNYKGKTDALFKLAEKPQTILNRFAEYQNDINKDSKMFGELIKFIDEGGVSIPSQIVANVTQFVRSLGFNEGDATDPAKAKRLLQNIAIDEATRILQESGKTLSDTDRQLVQQRVSKIDFTLEGSDPAIIKRQLQDIYDLVVVKAQQNLDRSVSWLEQNAGIRFDAPPTESEIKQMNELYGTSYTMDDFK